ncbi:DUF1905 domain-containing protein [Tissierella sp. MB52-C2]|uniref:DUF1905 domain-containing protein n=1 Tax=Tissierella sp. MB52-C2 TaxID=3070999 RepID=UPI00280C0FA8|nr:DUF1905 domain-containing protein [Tissierella sp. MB52-C2]WMM25472.1 DUF1905 domain-containing protein [Tissierella sp. MB52-C2]
MKHSFNMTMPDYDKNSRVFIELPFNVWNLFNKKGAIRVKGSINESPYECALIPRGNGTYLLPINKKIIEKSRISTGDTLNIYMEIVDNNEKNKPKVNELIEYRRIETINYIEQPNPRACGQACIAMLAGVNAEEVIKVMNTKGSTSIGQLIEALDYYKIKHSGTNKRISKKNPNYSEVCILTVHMPDYSHWVLYFKGKFYDPEFGVLENCHPDGKITSYLEIYRE